MHKYRQHVQQLKLMEEKEKMAVQIFNAGLAQVNNSNHMGQYYSIIYVSDNSNLHSFM